MAKIDIYWGAKDIPASQLSVFVWLGFTVTKQGTLKDITIERGSTAFVNEQMIKLFKSMPLFNPVFSFNREIEYHFIKRMEFGR